MTGADRHAKGTPIGVQKGPFHYALHKAVGVCSADRAPLLRGFPFDAVKIDRSFVRALDSDPQARVLVEGILGIARALQLDVVGEAVETQEQLALLTHLKCRWVQGYCSGARHPATKPAI